MVVCHQSILVKREKAPVYNLEYRLSADFDWVTRAVKNAAQTHNSRMILSRFLEGGLTRHNIKAGLKERFKIMRRLLWPDPNCSPAFSFWGQANQLLSQAQALLISARIPLRHSFNNFFSRESFHSQGFHVIKHS